MKSITFTTINLQVLQLHILVNIIYLLKFKSYKSWKYMGVKIILFMVIIRWKFMAFTDVKLQLLTSLFMALTIVQMLRWYTAWQPIQKTLCQCHHGFNSGQKISHQKTVLTGIMVDLSVLENGGLVDPVAF
jgi:hypothetical protein